MNVALGTALSSYLTTVLVGPDVPGLVNEHIDTLGGNLDNIFQV